MRVIAGEARGRPLLGPPTAATRPTADRIRQALFDMLDATGRDFGRVLDLFAGTGALGIEALSRGAEHATFVEHDRRTAAVIRRNLETLGMEDRAQVLVRPVPAALAILQGPYDLVLADPPYDWPGIRGLPAAVAATGILAPDGLLVLERRAGTPLPDPADGLRLERERRHGDTMLAIYHACEEGP